MAARFTIDRILRDDDDASGQSIRQWRIESEPGFITIRPREEIRFLLLRAADIELFIADLRRAVWRPDDQ